VREVRSPDGIILDRPTASVRNGAVPSDTAATLNDMMQRVIEDGELTGAQIEGTKVAGKTGTAENAPGSRTRGSSHTLRRTTPRSPSPS
jgi:peptidoglycan glycosyltransferase